MWLLCCKNDLLIINAVGLGGKTGGQTSRKLVCRMPLQKKKEIYIKNSSQQFVPKLLLPLQSGLKGNQRTVIHAA